MARDKAKVRDRTKGFLNRRNAHDLTPEQRTARARNRDLRQLRGERAERTRQLEVLQADVARLDAEIARVEAELAAAIEKVQ